MTTIVWFRQDLRRSDNPALFHAARRGAVLPVFILDRNTRGGGAPPGAAGRWWLHHSLRALRDELGGLLLLRGDPGDLLRRLLEQSGADAVYWNRCYEPEAIARDRKIKAGLEEHGLEVRSFNGALLHEPWELATRTGGPFKVYTAFWRAAAARSCEPPLPRPGKPALADLPAGEELDQWGLLPRAPDWAAGWEDLWRPGEAGAQERLATFLEQGLEGYGRLRDRPDLAHVSRLSAHLHFGEISPRQIKSAVRNLEARRPALGRDAEKFLGEIGWREFCHHLLYHFPELPERNWRAAFDAYPWRDNAADLEAWQRGMTGYPLVDAGMRELWRTGIMHNRVRMVAASFLVKHLRIHWRAGEAWFRDTLLDADLANNSAGWQWVAGSGADAAPYFRIFNPVAQGRKFDPEGRYVRRWCPELAGLDDKHLHAPFEADAGTLAAAGIELGRDYPKPMVDHAQARAAALAGYEAVKAAGSGAE